MISDRIGVYYLTISRYTTLSTQLFETSVHVLSAFLCPISLLVAMVAFFVTVYDLFTLLVTVGLELGGGVLLYLAKCVILKPQLLRLP